MAKPRKFIVKAFEDQYDQPNVELWHVDHHWMIRIGHHSTNDSKDGHLIYGIDIQCQAPLFDSEVKDLIDGLKLARQIADTNIGFDPQINPFTDEHDVDFSGESRYTHKV